MVFFNDDAFWKLHEQFKENDQGEENMQNDNPLIPAATKKELEHRAAVVNVENPLIPAAYDNIGLKRFSAQASSEYKGSAPSGKRFITSPDAAQLAIINKFTNREHTADELLVGQMRLANNCIDRDVERFSEETLQWFADTVVGRTLLLDHDANVNRSAIGKFYGVAVDKMPLQKAITETGESLLLPNDISEVWFLSPWFYIPKKGVSEKDLARLESGVFSHVSIGFSAERRVPITDGKGSTLFYEYQGRGETREGSIVYLGAQYGASIKSAASNTAPPSNVNDEATQNPLIPDRNTRHPLNPLSPDQTNNALIPS
jgi:hypothetical protein